MRNPPPVVLAAADRSGATLLRQMLNQHPGIVLAGECDFLVDAITPDGRFMKRDAFIRKMELNSQFQRRKFTIPPGLSFSGITHDLLDQVAATKPGAPVVGVTVQQHFDRLLWLWPDARFIHLVRDGRDVAMSTVSSGLAGTMWHGIADWTDTEALWERMSHKLPPEQQITVKYETLASTPEPELRRLTDFLGLPFDPAMIRSGHHPAHGAPGSESVGKWRKAERVDLSAAEHRAARWLLQNSYFLSGTVRPPSILRRLVLDIRNSLAIARHRRSLFGTRLWLRSLYARYLGGRKAKARIAREQNAILDRLTE